MSKLYLIGDSVMKGVTLLSQPQKYKICNEVGFGGLESRGVEVANRSRMGATVIYGRDTLERTLKNTPEGSAVIFEYGGNDCDFRWSEISADPDGDHLPNTPADVFEKTYRECIRTAREHGMRVAVTNLVPLDADKYLDWICRGLSRENILRWLGDTSMLYRWHEFYNKLVEKIAREEDCPLIDLRSEFLLSHRYRELICDDGIHPTDEGHRLIRSIIDTRAEKILA